MFPVAILAGGLATRLRSVNPNVPKSMIEVAGEPFVAHQLRQLRQEGIERIVLCVGHLGEQIRTFVGDGARFGLKISYSFDGDELLGTGGALKRALYQLGSIFFVLYGDSYLDVRYTLVENAFLRTSLPALMTVYHNDGRWDVSNVHFDQGRLIRYNKKDRSPEMMHIDYGLGVLKAEVLGRWTADKLDLAEIYTALADSGELAGYEVSQRFYEIGSPGGFAEIDAYLRGRSHVRQ
jgi:NDP-sugar pyrophosphorylase family protein